MEVWLEKWVWALIISCYPFTLCTGFQHLWWIKKAGQQGQSAFLENALRATWNTIASIGSNSNWKVLSAPYPLLILCARDKSRHTWGWKLSKDYQCPRRRQLHTLCQPHSPHHCVYSGGTDVLLREVTHWFPGALVCWNLVHTQTRDSLQWNLQAP